MWTIWNDSALLFDPRLDGYKVTSARLTQELNLADNLEFTIHTGNQNFGTLSRLKKTVEARNNGVVKSRLRMLDSTIGWYNEKEVLCEGALAWLNDTIQRPFEFPVDPTHAAPADYFAFLINRHNEQEPAERQLHVGICTVEDPNNYIVRSDTQYSTTMQLLREGLLNTLGGYLWLRYEGADTYIDYLADFDILANQPIRLGLNLLSLETAQRGAEICTAILPLGAMDETTMQRVTISGLTDEDTEDICKSGDIVYSKAAESMYGARIVRTVFWNDVTVNTNLLRKAKEKLAQARQLPSTITITAADLSDAGYDYMAFSVGTYVDIYDAAHSDAHSLLSRYLVKKITADLLNPSNSVLTLGATEYGFTDKQSQSVSDAMTAVEANIRMENAEVIRELETRNASAILQAENEIKVYVQSNTYTKSETDQLVASVATSVELTAEGLLIQFDELQQDVEDVASSADARFNALQSYISLAGGTITLGETGNPITLQIENDQIGIYANGNLITYWTAEAFVSPGTLRVPVGGRLELGNFAFIPRSSGSLDFKWIGA